MGALRWYRQYKAHVEGRLRAGQRPDMAATTATGPLDELVALHEELGAARRGGPALPRLGDPAPVGLEPGPDQRGHERGAIATRRGGRRNRCPVIRIRYATPWPASARRRGSGSSGEASGGCTSGGWSAGASTRWTARGSARRSAWWRQATSRGCTRWWWPGATWRAAVPATWVIRAGRGDVG
jgi:hypothetical protein